MNKKDLMKLIGQFGCIVAKAKGYSKSLHGRIKEVDSGGNVWFVDNDDFVHCFLHSDIKSFEVKEFKPLPENVYWDGGKIYNKETLKEVEIRK